MITKNPMQLKAYIKNKAAEKHISAQLVMQNYMLERLLERISLSPYKSNFILKGGFLISAIVGLDTPRCCSMTARSVFLPTTLKLCWRKSWKLCWPAILRIPVQEIITTYISYTHCAARNATKQLYGRR